MKQKKGKVYTFMRDIFSGEKLVIQKDIEKIKRDILDHF